MQKLYRYIGFEDFVNLFVNNKDRFVRPLTWEDKYEGYLFSKIEKKDDIRKIVNEMYFSLCPNNYHAIIDNYYKMWHSKWFTYAQCWSKFPETDAMWRCYSYGNRSIRIKTKDEILLEHVNKIFPKQAGYMVELRAVSYDLKKNSLLRTYIGKSTLVYDTFFHKRQEFAHEGEHRLIIEDNSMYAMSELSGIAAKFKIDELVEGMTDDQIIDCLVEKIYEKRADYEKMEGMDARIEDAGDISQYIEGVMVHPLAPQWYVKIIHDICKLKEFNFEGQSNLYTLK